LFAALATSNTSQYASQGPFKIACSAFTKRLLPAGDTLFQSVVFDVCVSCRYWTLAEAKPQHWEVPDSPLPSDIRFRQDLAALAACDLHKAQHYKELLEKQQRADRKLRETAGIYEH
jgi:hypothetical protein